LTNYGTSQLYHGSRVYVIVALSFREETAITSFQGCQ